MNTLLRFTAQNYRSICNQNSIVLTPRNNITDPPQTNIAIAGNTKYLKTIAIYGANSSGKSNWVKAINQMCRMVRRSNKRDPGELLPYEPFKLDETSSSVPTLFEAELMVEGKHYRYGFSYDKEKICSEWLCEILSSKKEKELFLRDQEGIGVDEVLFPEGKDKEELTTNNRLFVPLVAQMNGAIAKSILGFFFGKINTLSGLDTDGLEEITKEMLKDQKAGVDTMKSNMFSWEDFMKLDLLALSFCDAICLLPDWAESTGAMREYEEAKKLGLKIMFYDFDKKEERQIA